MLDIAALQKQWNETYEAIGGALESLNNVPSSVQVPADDAGRKALLSKAGDGVGGDPVNSVIGRRIMAVDQVEEIRASLKSKSLRELHMLFAKQAGRRDTGVPLYDWLGAGGAPVSARFGGANGIPGIQAHVEPSIAKAIDTTGVAALIRQDLEPIVYEIFVRKFPLYDAIPHEPANGLVHAWNQQLSYGEADWIGELDTVVDDKGVYHRATTNIGILATRRGVSLKSQFAVLAGGAGFNPERLELEAGLTAMRHTFQKTMLQGNGTDPTGTASDEKGLYDLDAWDGLRKLLNTSSAVNVDPATNPDTTGSIRRAVDAAMIPITDAGGGDNLAVWGDIRERVSFDEQQDDKLRIIQAIQGGETAIGVQATRVVTAAGNIPFFPIRGQAVGTYTATGTYAGNTVRDLSVLDMDGFSVPYLGTDGPTVLEIPIGVTGQLTHLFVIFMMGGFAQKRPSWSNKIRVKV